MGLRVAALTTSLLAFFGCDFMQDRRPHHGPETATSPPPRPRLEGTEPGDCDDRADNDADGAFDCDDSGCATSPDCAEVARGVDTLVPMESMVMNLASGPTHYAKVTIQLGVARGQAQAVERAKPVLRSRMLLYFSGMGIDQTVGRDARERITRELKTAFNEALGAEKITGVFFTEFVVQAD